ncbi:amidohydrolase family protein [Luteimonas sp. Y-2-2-4F]|nr:amidohydrolase family protein [Luteimonas sp. Y-2-2-4F]MCD9033178.1 amidohydrolase family protein [Luteimonas sp. Y-2-2-4F]
MSGWDCHAHLFGPYARYPLADSSVHAPPEAPLADYLALLERLGLDHGVLVQPSAYGRDASAVLDALGACPRLRAVLVARAGEAPALAGLRARGVRALRFSQRRAGRFPGAADLDDLVALAPALADAGLHAELWTDAPTLAGIAPLLAALPVPVAIDHMGGFDPAAGIDQPGFSALRRLLAAGGTWVKLCAYRNTGGDGLAAAAPFQRALAAANPERLLWGSDWPHLRVDPAPDAAALLAAMVAACPEPGLAGRILRDNPAALYA